MNKPQRVAFVAPFGLGQKTTVWARILPLARQLVCQGHSAAIIIPPWDTPSDAGKSWIDGGVQVINVKLGGGAPSVALRMVGVLGRLQPDYVHIVKPRAHAGLVQWWLWQRRRLQRNGPTLLLDVDDWEQAWATINGYSPLVARFLAWQEEWGIRHADGITAASGWLVDRVRQYTPQTPVLYLPNGIDDAIIEEKAPLQSIPVSNAEGDQPNNILFFSRFVEVEPLWLAEFWRAMQGQWPSTRLLVAGNALQPGREKIFQQAMAQVNPAGANQIEWLGYIQPADISALYARSSCAIFPAMPTPLLQAKCSVRLATTLLQGVPVVASAVGEQAAYGAAGAAYLVAPEATAEQFADMVGKLLQQPGQRQQLIQQAHRHLAADYRWSRLGQQLHQFYAGFQQTSAK